MTAVVRGYEEAVLSGRVSANFKFSILRSRSLETISVPSNELVVGVASSEAGFDPGGTFGLVEYGVNERSISVAESVGMT